MPLPIDFDANDISHVAKTAKRCMYDSKAAGGSYREIAHLAWSFNSVLSTIQASFSELGSSLAQQGNGRVRDDKRELAESIRGCEAIVDEVMVMLESHGGVGGRGESSSVRRVWNRTRYTAAQIEARLNAIRSRLTTGIASIMSLLDDFEITSTARVESTFDVTRREIRAGENGARSVIWDVVQRLRRREERRRGMRGENEWADGDEREWWEQIKSELRIIGFRSREVGRSKRVLMAYIREEALSPFSMSAVPRDIDRRSHSPSEVGSMQSRGRRRVSQAHAASGQLIPASPPPPYPRSPSAGTIPDHPPPPYTSRPYTNWNGSSSTISIPRSRSPDGYGTRARQRRGITAGQIVVLGVAIAGVSFIALNHYSRRRRMAREGER